MMTLALTPPRLLLASDVHSIGKIGLDKAGGAGLLLSSSNCRSQL